ncbi:MAG TPA: NGG1p interacting factor NIF3 [Patescibacteria group bacterium]|nr:NGG1p interacting factor NIF3 [Patescibacteria group bacterium]
MNTKDIFKIAVDKAIEADLRGKSEVEKRMTRINKKFNELSEKQKVEFDKEKLNNPYVDSRILNNPDETREIKKVMTGIDIDSSELLLADKLGDVDLVISHHPQGAALAELSAVMDLQAEVLAKYGLPINIAEAVTKFRAEEVNRGLSPINHYRAVDTAKILGLDFMCTHTTADNLAARFMHDLIQEKKPEYVEDIFAIFKEIPEYQESSARQVGPKLFAGSKDSRVGKVVVTEFTGGTSGSKDVFEKMAHYGFGTIIGMHMSEEHRKEAEKHHMNVIIAGHMSSDSLGMNLFLDEIEKQGIEVIPTSGLIRVKRFNEKK